MLMRARVGDQLVVRGQRVGLPERRGEVIEVRGDGGAPPYLVRWHHDGSSALFSPGSDAVIVPAAEHRA
jgi:hypothetical protein